MKLAVFVTPLCLVGVVVLVHSVNVERSFHTIFSSIKWAGDSCWLRPWNAQACTLPSGEMSLSDDGTSGCLLPSVSREGGKHASDASVLMTEDDSIRVVDPGPEGNNLS